MTTIEQIKELAELSIAWYASDRILAMSLPRKTRRTGQIIAMAEVLRLIDGDERMLDQLRGMGLVPLRLDDLPRREGGKLDDSAVL